MAIKAIEELDEPLMGCEEREDEEDRSDELYDRWVDDELQGFNEI